MTKIIAELAQGYEGDENLAELLVEAACFTKADAIKLQCVYADELAVPSYKYYGLFKSLEMPVSIWNGLVRRTHDAGKEIYFDVFGEMGLDIAVKCKIDGVKLHSTDFFNDDLIREIFAHFNKIFVSIGGMSLGEIEMFVQKYVVGDKDVCLMFGHQTEPTPIHENNINRLHALSAKFPQLKLGFMDHSEFCSNEAQTLSLLSLPFGVNYIEKHLTLDQKLRLEDYISAITPTEFDKFVSSIRHHEIALGDDSFDLKDGDLKYRNNIIKVVVANQSLGVGHKIERVDVALKRVGYSENRPKCFYTKSDVMGRVLTVAVEANDIIGVGDIL